MGFQSFLIAGSSIGLQTDEKPYIIPDQAFPVLDNAYIWRNRVIKREGLKLLGRLRRVSSNQSIGNSGASPWTFNIYSTLVPPITPETNAEIQPGSVIITIQAGPDIVFTDQGDGTLTSPTAGNSGIINYLTGNVTLTTTAVAGTPTIITFGYFPALPNMGIDQREIFSINNEQTIFFDTKYAYIYVGDPNSTGGFQEFIPGTTWTGTDADYFWSTNYRGSNPEDRLFFTTNFYKNAGLSDPIRYTDGITWTNFTPLITATDTLYQGKILVPYYGRLIILNTWEGTTVGGVTSAVNIYNRCRFSQIGNPIAVDAFRSDLFGKGGFIDAPVDEAIMSARFFKNTLIVGFERSTWQLRYVGEYGLPFIWERISSDFGTESTFSTILFDQGVLQVGNTAITSATAVTVNRIDEKIPDLVFNMRNADNGLARIHGIRDFEREMVFWCYSDSQLAGKYPNKTLVYNYRNNTYAIFRENIMCFGYFQTTFAITWDSLTTFWDDEKVTWDDPDTQSLFPYVVAGNQQGFIHFYGITTKDEESLAITQVDLTVSPNLITIPNHNLETGDIVYFTDLTYAATPSIDLNDNFFQVRRIDADNIEILSWDGSAYINTPSGAAATYIGGGRVTLFPRLQIQSKDFNPYMQMGGQFKLSYIDFLTDAEPDSVMSVLLFINSSPSVQANLLVGNTQNEQYLTQPYYVPQSEYAWHRLFATANGQFLRFLLTYDDELMNEMTTHESNLTINAVNLWMRPGGRSVF